MGLNTLSDWAQYVVELTGDQLRSKAIAANTQRFADSLRAEGMSMDDIQIVIRLFVQQLIAMDQKIPEGGAFDLHRIARQEAQAGTVAVMTEEEAATLAGNPVEPPDGLEEALQAMSLEQVSG